MKNINKSTHSPKRQNQNVRDTSKMAFADYNASGQAMTQWQFAAKVLKEVGQVSRQMLSRATGLPINHITQIVKTLIQKGIAIELPEKRICQVTGKKVYYLALKKE